MRLQSLFLAALAGLTLFATSCKKDDNTVTTTTPTAQAGMSFKVGANTYSFTPATQAEINGGDVVLNKAAVTINASNDTISIGGSHKVGNDTLVLVISLPLTAARTGTYSLNATASSANFLNGFYAKPATLFADLISNPMGVATWTTSGSVNLTKVDLANKKVSGTFAFNQAFGANNTYNVTEGKMTDLPIYAE